MLQRQMPDFFIDLINSGSMVALRQLAIARWPLAAHVRQQQLISLRRIIDAAPKLEQLYLDQHPTADDQLLYLTESAEKTHAAHLQRIGFGSTLSAQLQCDRFVERLLANLDAPMLWRVDLPNCHGDLTTLRNDNAMFPQVLTAGGLFHAHEGKQRLTERACITPPRCLTATTLPAVDDQVEQTDGYERDRHRSLLGMHARTIMVGAAADKCYLLLLDAIGSDDGLARALKEVRKRNCMPGWRRRLWLAVHGN